LRWIASCTAPHKEPINLPGGRFRDRQEAGQQLAGHLTPYAARDDVVVLALPRGGVPVAFEVARALKAPLDVFLVRKLGAPGHPEFAIGAIATGGVRVLSHDVIAELGIPSGLIEQVAEHERIELERRDKAYHGDRPPLPLGGKIVIVVDDGLATGSTMEAAVSALREHHPARVIVAAPVGAADSCRRLRALADDVICVATPDPFNAVGLWYRTFDQTSDAEVVELLQRADTQAPRGRRTTPTYGFEQIRKSARILTDEFDNY
jgi:putative phosphoribosyl transferase